MESLTFEVKSIQAFIFASGRLRDAIGASELIDLLTNEDAPGNLLDAVLAASQTREDVEFSRRAGGAFYAFSHTPEPLDRFASLWTLAVQQRAPGLEFVLGRGKGDSYPDAFSNAQKDARSLSSRERGTYPFASPVTLRSRRTGRAAVTHDPKDGGVDATVRSIKSYADLSQAGFIDRYTPLDSHLTWRDWPRNLDTDAPDDESFPFLDEDRNIAVIHADGNGMGQILIRMGEAVRNDPETYPRIYQTFSKAIERSTRHAARRATLDVLLPARKNGERLAARPILLGGDDVIVLVRADLALAYVRSFACAFEEESRRQLAELSRYGVTGLPGHMTMGFGVAFVAANQPFAAAVKLAESIMSYAKSRAKESVPERSDSASRASSMPPSSVAFFRLTASMAGDYQELIARTSTSEGVIRYIHTLGTYAVSASQNCRLPCLEDLERLVAHLRSEGMARGPIRGLLNMLHLDPAQARISWRRWRQRMEQTYPEKLRKLDQLLAKLLRCYAPDGSDLPYAKTSCIETADVSDDSGRIDRSCSRTNGPSEVLVSPLGDALDLLAVSHSVRFSLEATEAVS